MQNKSPTECTRASSLGALMMECRLNEKERKEHSIPENIFEIIGPDYQSEDIIILFIKNTEI